MSLLLESIKIENRTIRNFPYHLYRMEKSLFDLYHSKKKFAFNAIQDHFQDLDENTYKLRILYNQKVFKYEILPYFKPQIQSIKLVSASTVFYDYKYEDRSILNDLFLQRANADDILIVKNKLITDSLFCNVALLKKGEWFTPQSPLLNGTKRSYLIDQKKIIPIEITVDQLSQFEKISLFNAMIG